MRHIPKPYEIYRHFKGKLYQIVTIAQSSEDGSKQVVYQALYEPFTVYVRPLEMFMSQVDRDKYPEAEATYRFEQVEEKAHQDMETVREEKPAQADADMPEGEGTLDPLLLDFLDADTYAQKLEIFRLLRSRITQDMITTIAVALDLEVDEGELEERCRQVEHCLATFEKYECNRLR